MALNVKGKKFCLDTGDENAESNVNMLTVICIQSTTKPF